MALTPRSVGVSHSIRFHDLRHTAATLMLTEGVPLTTISKTLGHSGIAITADLYAHVGDDLQKAAADAMEHLFGSESDTLS